MDGTIILYGMPGSLYTGKVRAYLRRRGLAHEERVAGDARFLEEIMPAVGRWIIPVVQLPDGSLIQDGTDILDRLEALYPPADPIVPADPLLRVIAEAIGLFGNEGLLRPAMHYRWNFDADNLAFLKEDFAFALAPGADEETRAKIFERSSGRMRQATSFFGVSAESAAQIEASYAQFLRLLSTHLDDHPHLLGGVPTVADYGLFNPLYAHLGRDPHPAQMMKQTAPRVWRWTERMNAPTRDVGEYAGCPQNLLDPNALPPGLIALLRYMAEDYGPELLAHVAFANGWLAQRPELKDGTNGLDDPGMRAIGMTEVAWRGLTLTVVVLPYRLYLLQRVQDAADAVPPDQRGALDALLSETGLDAWIRARTIRRVERSGHLEVWGPLRSV